MNCCGAWTDGVEPYKGQMLTVRLPKADVFDYVIRSPEVYLVPRGDGLVVIGATVERVGFYRRVEPDGPGEGCARGRRRCGLQSPVHRMVESWSGFRPGTGRRVAADRQRTGEPRCWMASGHFRNGILLAPATALVIRQLLQGERPAVSVDAFAPERLLRDKA